MYPQSIGHEYDRLCQFVFGNVFSGLHLWGMQCAAPVSLPEGRENPAGKTGSAIVVNNGKYTKMGVSWGSLAFRSESLFVSLQRFSSAVRCFFCGVNFFLYICSEVKKQGTATKKLVVERWELPGERNIDHLTSVHFIPYRPSETFLMADWGLMFHDCIIFFLC